MIFINKELCKACYICIEFCPKKVFTISKELNKKGVYPSEVDDESRCTYCKICELMCPDQAITVVKK